MSAPKFDSWSMKRGQFSCYRLAAVQDWGMSMGDSARMKRTYNAWLLAGVLGAFLLTCGAAKAAMVMPRVYHEWTVDLGRLRFGIAETERVHRGEFRKEIVPGKRQVILDLGPPSWTIEIPCSLTVFLLCVGGLPASLAAAFGWRKRRGT